VSDRSGIAPGYIDSIDSTKKAAAGDPRRSRPGTVQRFPIQLAVSRAIAPKRIGRQSSMKQKFNDNRSKATKLRA